MSAEKLELVTGGLRYEGWKSIRVTRTIESLAGSFALDVSDKWGNGSPWPIVEEDECRVDIDGEAVITGYVDKRSLSGSKDSRTLSYQGRDRAAALMDCSAVLPKWTYYDVNVANFAATVAAPFGVRVTVQAGLVLPKVSKLVISPGDSAYDAIMKATADQGVLLVSDGAGGITITRSSSERATSLVEGQNIVSASVEYDGAERFRRYVIATQVGGTDEASGNATRIRAEATDDGVRRSDRVLLIRPDKGYNVADARRRGDWEARIRAARAETVTVVVLGWRQPDGKLWPLNALTRVRAPRLIGVDGDMRIATAEHSVGDQGNVTQLRLVRPDAFSPEPTAKVKASGALWKAQFEKGTF